MSGWIGVDLDGCLAVYHGWEGAELIGDPVPDMLERVKNWIAEDYDVRIFTARIYTDGEHEILLRELKKSLDKPA